MVITNNELVSLGFLECLATGVALPDGCDTSRLARLGWIARGLTGTWTLTTDGERSLASLRAANQAGPVGS